MSRNTAGMCQIYWKKCYEGVRFNVISVTRGWVDVRFPEKNTAEHLIGHLILTRIHCQHLA